jgi:hypothetical protein
MQTTRLNEVQVSLLRMFDWDMSQEETLEIRRLLTKHYADKARQAATEVALHRGYTQADYDQMLNQQQRTP